MLHVFLSYRRRESSGYSRHIHERLMQEFGVHNVFMDVTEIAPGVNWRAMLSRQIEIADTMLVLIGREWLDIRDPTGKRRLEDPDDVTRLEIAEALRRGKRVIPVLLEGAALPPRDALPADLQNLADLQAVRLDHESFDADLQALVEHLMGRRLRDQLASERGHRRILSWAMPVVLTAVFVSAVFALLGALDLLALETRIETQTVAAASLIREPPVADDLVVVAAVPAREAPGPEFRVQYAQLIDALARDGATAIVIDVRFQQASAGQDAVLAAAFTGARARQTDVHFAFNALREDKPLAVPALAAAAGSAGFACVGKRLGVTNVVPIVLRRDERLWPGLALLAAAPGASLVAFDADARRVTIQLKDGRQREVSLSYVEPADTPQTTCPIVSKDTLRGYVLVEIPAIDVFRRTGRWFDLDAVVHGRVPAGTFTRKTVIVGVQLPEESFLVARGLGREMRYGYEIHALTASALIAGAVPRKLGLALEGWLFLLVGALGAVIGYTTKRCSRWPAAALLAAVAVGYFVVTVLIFAESGILPNTGYDLVSLLCSSGLMRSLSRRWLPWTSRLGHSANA